MSVNAEVIVDANDVVMGAAGPWSVPAEFLARLRGFIRKRVRFEHDADDIAQEVLARFVEHADSIDSQSMYAWMFTVARRAVIDHARRSGARPSSSLDDEGVIAASFAGSGSAIAGDIADDPSAVADLARCMEPMLAALSRDDRALLQRVDMLGEAQADLARELGMSMSGMKSRVQRARRRLRAQLEDCCIIERDRRNAPIDVQRRPNRPCPCDGCGPARDVNSSPVVDHHQQINDVHLPIA